MQAVYAYHKNEEINLQQAEKNLFHSISKSFELYHLYLLLFIEIKCYAEKRIEIGRNKKIPLPEELNPNTRFINNMVLCQLAENSYLQRFVEQTGLSWSNYPEIIKAVYQQVIGSELYAGYMASNEESYEGDRKFIVKLAEKVIAQYEPLYSNIEEQSIFWNDESEFVINMAIKTLREYRQQNGAEQPLLPEFKDDDDREFAKRLFRKAIMNHTELSELVKKLSKNWELERIAFMDIVLMDIALAEMMEFSTIALKVTINEYIEIAKHYSTPKSGTFINGLLEKIITEYIEQGKIKKIGDELLKLN